MITATVTVTTTSTSLFDLINTAIPNKLDPKKFNGRVAEIQIHWVTDTFYLFDIPGPVNDGAGPGPEVATNAGYQFSDPVTDLGVGETLLVVRQGGLNGLSLNDLYLGTTAGTATARILAYSI